jgi:hypothetical protein
MHALLSGSRVLTLEPVKSKIFGPGPSKIKISGPGSDEIKILDPGPEGNRNFAVRTLAVGF